MKIQMKLIDSLRKWTGILWLVCLAGCATPKSVLDLATVTGANTSRLGTQLSAFADQESDIAKLRADNMAVMVGELATIDYSKRTRTLEAMRLAGQNDSLNVYTNLVASSEKMALAQEAIPQEESQQRSLILNSQKQLSAPTTQLSAVSKTLVALGKDMSFQAWLEFYIQYGQDVDKGIQQQEQQLANVKTNAIASSAALKASVTANKTH